MKGIFKASAEWEGMGQCHEGMTVIVSFADSHPQVRVITEDCYSLVSVCVCVLQRSLREAPAVECKGVASVRYPNVNIKDKSVDQQRASQPHSVTLTSI